ncbi:preprotein translocase subunit SecA, partial [Pseudomonas nitroreducens]|uniref:preprotein translocase subunit SecA n=1 Tax=Pseudomonas nitroreducens TaxID=46680 RepID=UPI003CC8333A
SKLYIEINKLIPRLKQHIEEEEGVVTQEGHYKVDEKSRQVELNEQGHQYIEDMLTQVGLLAEGESLYSAHNLGLLTHVYAALRAHTLFQRNVEYIVQNGQVVLIDEHTGRTMQGRRLSEGLHQAIEAKEGVNIQAESQTLASTTFQNYFRLYTKLAGMTGTADTEAFEFRQTYGLDVVVIPTHRPVARKDFNDLVYLTQDEKYAAIITDVQQCQALGRPILVGTASVETSEYVSQLLQNAGIEHKVLNAKYHEKEAEIIAQAGRPGSVTIATNMAGRGTDILLGGNWEVEVAALENPTDEQVAQIKADWQKRHQQVIESGGLHVIASERHESRRIDNQLRGRAGRQGDPGSSRFYLSLEDHLMRIFASDRVKNFMKALGMQPGEAIEHRMVTNAIEKAQRKVEGRNFDIRKQLLEFDDVANEQRKVIYHMRNTLLAADNIGETIVEFREETLNNTVSEHIPPQSLPEQWDVAGLEAALYSDFGLKLPIQQWLDDDEKLYEETLREKILTELVAAYNEKEDMAGAEALRTFEKQMLLRVLDDLWKDHLSTMDHLRHGIHLRGYAQKNPKQEYKRESFNLFQELLNSIKRDTIRVLSFVQVRREDPAEEEARLRREAEEMAKRMQFQHAAAPSMDQVTDEPEEEGEVPADNVVPMEPIRNEPKIGRNEPCPCGSGKKYKHCHGQVE